MAVPGTGGQLSRRGAKRTPRATQEATLTIDALGGRGHGVARFAGSPVYIPFTAPGDRVRVGLTPRRDGAFDGSVTERLASGDARAEPPCRHFGTCGGCAMQHLVDGAYTDWKLETLRTALVRQGLGSPAFEPMVRTPPGGRRRVRWAGIGRENGLVLGFNEPGSHRIVDLTVCPVVSPRLAALMTPLRDWLGPVVASRQRLDIEALDLPGGLDIGIIAPFAPDLAVRESVGGFAERHDVARMTWRGSDRESPEPLLLRRAVQSRFADVAVDLPPGAFMQASAMAEAALTDFVLRHASGPIVELFAGAGTFTLPLAARGERLTAIEGDQAMAAALSAAIRRGALADRVRIETRDLVRRPLRPEELDGSGCVLLDPPRAGAGEQVGGIAGSSVATLIYVSCSPVSFARDARRLGEAGFRLERLLPVDQFLWSPHLELVALLRR